MILPRFAFRGIDSGTDGFIFFGGACSHSERRILNLAMPACSSVHLKAWFSTAPTGRIFFKFHEREENVVKQHN